MWQWHTFITFHLYKALLHISTFDSIFWYLDNLIPQISIGQIHAQYVLIIMFKQIHFMIACQTGNVIGASVIGYFTVAGGLVLMVDGLHSFLVTRNLNFKKFLLMLCSSLLFIDFVLLLFVIPSSRSSISFATKN